MSFQWSALRLSFPLLGKELTEQAAQRRTYLVRVGYALALFGVACLILYEWIGRSRQNPFLLLGHGRDLFETLVFLQFAGIFLFLPAMMAGVITAEKERDTLSLLFLTDMRPGEILLQKYFGRLIPMFALLLLGMPLLAVAYSLGGISPDYLFAGVYLLALTALQIGAFALMISTLCGTTVTANLVTYLGGAAFYLFIPVCLVVIDEVIFSRSITRYLYDQFGATNSDRVVFVVVAPALFDTFKSARVKDVLLWSIPMVVSTVLFLVIARLALVQRAFARPRSSMLAAFRKMDEFYKRLNKGLPSYFSDEISLPRDEPIAWREVTKKPLGTVRYMFRILISLEIIVLFFLLGLSGSRTWSGQSGMFTLTAVPLWLIALLALTVKSVSLIASERISQTLEVLVTTPLTGRAIISQKLRGIWRLLIAFAVPLLTVIATEWWWESKFDPRATKIAIAQMFSVAVFLPFFCLLSLWIGLRAFGRHRAVFGALLIVTLWNVLPILLGTLGEMLWCAFKGVEYVFNRFGVWEACAGFSPMVLVVWLEQAEGWAAAVGGKPWIAGSLVTHATLICLFLWRCLRHADRFLGRVEEPL